MKLKSNSIGFLRSPDGVSLGGKWGVKILAISGKTEESGSARAIEITGIAHEFVRCYHLDSTLNALVGTRYVRSKYVWWKAQGRLDAALLP